MGATIPGSSPTDRPIRSRPLWSANGRRRSSSVSTGTRIRNRSHLSPSRPKPKSSQFREQFADSAYRLLEPVDPTVNYSFEVMAADPWTMELTADKWWLETDGQVGHEGQTLKTYSLESFEWEREIEREVAAMDVENLHRTYQDEGLEAAMRRAEGIAVANHELDPNRADGRLFTEGPTDRFTAVREVQLMEMDAAAIDATIRDITNDETQELPAVAPEPGSWDELVAQQTDDDPEPERPLLADALPSGRNAGRRAIGDGAVRDRVPAAPA